MKTEPSENCAAHHDVPPKSQEQSTAVIVSVESVGCAHCTYVTPAGTVTAPLAAEPNAKRLVPVSKPNTFAENAVALGTNAFRFSNSAP